MSNSTRLASSHATLPLKPTIRSQPLSHPAFAILPIPSLENSNLENPNLENSSLSSTQLDHTLASCHCEPGKSKLEKQRLEFLLVGCNYIQETRYMSYKITNLASYTCCCFHTDSRVAKEEGDLANFVCTLHPARVI